MLTRENIVQIIGKSRVADLKPGDFSQHAGGGCTCGESPGCWRVEVVDTDQYCTEVTWSHPPCGVVARPLSCSHDCPVEVWG